MFLNLREKTFLRYHDFAIKIQMHQGFIYPKTVALNLPNDMVL